MPIPNTYGKKPGKGEVGDSQGMLINGFVLGSEYRQDLKGILGVRKFREMMSSDATVRQLVQIITLPIRSLKWSVQEASDDPKDTEIKDFVVDVLDNMDRTFDEFLFEALMHVSLGRYVHEICYDFNRPDGKIGIEKLAARPPETLYQWLIDDPVPHIVQRTIHGTYNIPFEKAVLLVNEQEGYNFEGFSLLRPAFPHWYLKHKLYLIDAMASERQGLGIPEAQIPNGATPDQKAEMIKLLQSMRAMEKGYVTYPSSWKVGFMDMMAKSLKDMMPSADHHDKQIMKAGLAAFMELGNTRSATGSYALSENNSQFFIMGLEAVRDYVRASLNKQLIKRIVDINFVTDKYPYFITDTLNRIDIKNLADSVSSFVTSQTLTVTPDVEDMIRKGLELPENTGLADIDPSMADEMIKELQGEMNGLHTQMGAALAPGAKTNSTEPDQPNPLDPAQMQQTAEKAGWTSADWYEAAIDLKLMKGDDETPPAADNPNDPPRVEDKLKQQIMHHFSPNIPYKKHKEYTKIGSEVNAFSHDARYTLLTKLAKGEQVTPKDSAKIQLDLFKKKGAISNKINNLRNDVHLIKHKNEPAPVDPNADVPVDEKKKKAADKIRDQKDRVDAIIETLEHEIKTANTQ